MAYRPEYSQLSDDDLVKLFQQGDRHGAFTVLVERYQKRIYFAARKMVGGSHDEADDIAQQTFVKAYDALESFRSEAKLYTWLYRIMLNAVIQRSRRSKVRQTVDIDGMEDFVESGELRADELMEKSETTRIIEKAMESLPPKQRQVFIMRFYDEMPYEEIAAAVGTSVGGLKANYFHAVRKVGEYLRKVGKISPQIAAQMQEEL